MKSPTLPRGPWNQQFSLNSIYIGKIPSQLALIKTLGAFERITHHKHTQKNCALEAVHLIKWFIEIPNIIMTSNGWHCNKILWIWRCSNIRKCQLACSTFPYSESQSSKFQKSKVKEAVKCLRADLYSTRKIILL